MANALKWIAYTLVTITALIIYVWALTPDGRCVTELTGLPG